MQNIRSSSWLTAWATARKGPEKDDPGFDVTCYMARGGVFGTTVNRGDSPMIPTNGYGDLQASMFLAAGVCAAIIGRNQTGEGEYVTCALQHAAIYALMTGMISAQYGNPYPKSRLEVICPFNNVYTAGDGKSIAMCDPEYDRDYDKIMGLIGREDLIGSERLNNCNKMNADGLNAEVVDILDEALAKMTAAEALKIFKDAGIPCELCQTPLDVYEDQNALVNDYLVKIKYPEAERWVPLPHSVRVRGSSQLHAFRSSWAAQPRKSCVIWAIPTSRSRPQRPTVPFPVLSILTFWRANNAV